MNYDELLKNIEQRKKWIPRISEGLAAMSSRVAKAAENGLPDRGVFVAEAALARANPGLTGILSTFETDVDFFIAKTCFCDSPIESAFMESILAIAFEWVTSIVVDSPSSERDPQGARYSLFRPGNSDPCELLIEKQAQIGKYKADFKLTVAPNSLVVECDGHDFHERTKEQASHDKRRDRDFTKIGLTVFRYSGSDIWKDPIRCAEETLNFLTQGRI